MTISTESFVIVNTGASANDGTGDSLRAAFVKVNQNFANIENIGFDAGNINVTGAIEVTGDVTAARFISDGSQINGNVVVDGATGNLTVRGTIQKKYEDTQNVATSSTSLTLQPGGDQLKFFRITGNVDIGYNLPIVAGSQVEATVWNDSAGNVWINLPNAKTSTARGNILVQTQGYARLVFTAFGNDSGNVFVGVSA